MILCRVGGCTECFPEYSFQVTSETKGFERQFCSTHTRDSFLFVELNELSVYPQIALTSMTSVLAQILLNSMISLF